MVKRPDEDQAGVRSLGFGPLTCEWCEVAAVARDQYASLGCDKIEHMQVREPLEGHVFGERQHIMACLAQLGRYTARGEVGVKQQAQAWLCRGGELDEGVELVPLRGGALVLRYRLRDLPGVAIAVGDGKARLSFC